MKENKNIIQVLKHLEEDGKEIKTGNFDTFDDFLIYFNAHYVPLLDRLTAGTTTDDDKRLISFLSDDLKAAFKVGQYVRTDTIDNFPVWALCYVVNSDASGLDDEDIEMIDNYICRLKNNLCAKWVDICPPDDEETHFSYYPEFGEGADVCTVSILYEVEQ